MASISMSFGYGVETLPPREPVDTRAESVKQSEYNEKRSELLCELVECKAHHSRIEMELQELNHARKVAVHREKYGNTPKSKTSSKRRRERDD